MTDKKSFEQKVVSLKGTDCPKTENLCNFVIERSTSPSDLHVDRSAQGFFTFTVEKTQFRGLCLLPLSRALSELSKYETKKGVILF